MNAARDVIAQALALSEAASKGPWAPAHGQILDATALPDDPDADPWVADVGHHAGNAEFIAAARTLLPALAKALGDVLALADQYTETDWGDREWGDIPGWRLRDAITAALSAEGGTP